MTKFLIVNADDLGICSATNRAIHLAFRQGMLTSASLMANMPAFVHAVHTTLAANPGMGVGLHLCLTSGRPVLDRSEVPLLVDAEGNFGHGFFALWRRLRSERGEELLAQIARELQAQAAAIDAAGVTIDHVNGHQHVHMLPGVFPLAAELARQRGAAIRLPVERLRRRGGTLARQWARLTTGGTLKAALLKRLALDTVALAGDVYQAPSCLGIGESGRLTSPVLADLLNRLPEGVSEIFSHPGEPGEVEQAQLMCSGEDAKFLRSPRRAAEFAALTSQSLQQALRGQDIVLTSFRDVLRGTDALLPGARKPSPRPFAA